MLSFNEFLTEGKVLDDAVAIAKKSIRDYYTKGPGSRMSFGSFTAEDYIKHHSRQLDDYLEVAQQFFQKRPGVPNANWLNWLAKNIKNNIEDIDGDERMHFSDFMARHNRMANWDFNRFANWDDALIEMDRLQTVYNNKKSGLKSYSSPEFTALADTLDDEERMELGKRKSHSEGEVLVPGDEAKVIVDCGGGWKWFDLGKGFCNREGKSMMHCGNVNGKTRPEETIFSLRHEVDGKWVPFLTFIYNTKYASLGEMKASGNRKPSKFFHPMIVKLLNAPETTELPSGHKMNGPLVRYIRGGGYRQEANFSLDDLTNAQLEEVLSLPGHEEMRSDWMTDARVKNERGV